MATEGYTLSSEKTLKFPIETRVIAPFNEPKLDACREEITISDEALESSVVRMVVHQLNSPKRRKRSPVTIKLELNWLKYELLPYVNSIEHFDQKQEDTELFNSDFIAWLKKRKDSGNRIANIWNMLQRFANSFCTDRSNNEPKTTQILDLRERKQLKLELESAKTLSELHPDLKLENDLNLLVGCQEFLLWYLNEMDSLRQYIWDNLTPRLKKYYENLKISKKAYAERYANFSIGITSITCEAYGKKKTTPNFAELTDLLKIIHSYPSPPIQEMMFVELLGVRASECFYLEKGRIFTLQEINEFMSNLWTNSQSSYGPKHPKSEREKLKSCYTGRIEELYLKDLAHTNFPSLSFLVTPSKAEKLAMSWLLAAARSQPSGIEKLTYEDNVLHDPKKKTIQIVQEKKNRQRKSQQSQWKQGHDSPIYQNDNHYAALNAWVKLVTQAHEFVADNDGFFLPNFPKTDLDQSRRNIHFFLWLASIEGTLTNSALQKCFTGKANEHAVNDFLTLLKKEQQANFDTYRTFIKNQHERKLLIKAGHTPPQKKRKKPEIRRITLTVLAQTRAIIDDPNNKHNFSLVGHTEETHYNTYLNRTNSKFVHSKSALWAANVGNAFIEEAMTLYGVQIEQKAIDRIDRTELVSIEEAKKLLNLRDITCEEDVEFIQEVINQAEAEGFAVDLAATLKSNDKTIVLITPWVCALIIANIQNVKERLSTTKVTTNQKAFAQISEIIYFELLLERFPAHMKQHAKKLLSEYDIPFEECT